MKSITQSQDHSVAGVNSPASHIFLDLYQLALHRRVSELLLNNPDSIINQARANLMRWIQSGNFTVGELASLDEWRDMLDRLPVAELIRRITDPSDEGQRIRQNSPFVRILPHEESRRIREACEETATR